MERTEIIISVDSCGVPQFSSVLFFFFFTFCILSKPYIQQQIGHNCTRPSEYFGYKNNGNQFMLQLFLQEEINQVGHCTNFINVVTIIMWKYFIISCQLQFSFLIGPKKPCTIFTATSSPVVAMKISRQNSYMSVLTL